MHSCKSFLKALTLVGVIAFVSSAAAETKTWKGSSNARQHGSGNTGYWASTAVNWEPSGAPVDGDEIVFDETSQAGGVCQWDLDIKPASWTQTADFLKAVTFLTEFEEYEGMEAKFVEITGNVTLNGGSWTHLKPTKVERRYRLYVKIGGSLSVGADAKITAKSLGYQTYYSYLQNATPTHAAAFAGSHGGFGDWVNAKDTPLTTGCYPYGNSIVPEEPGAGANTVGGGSIRLEVAGDLTLNGTVDADAGGSYYGGAGGSVYVRAGSISGSGRISADAIHTDNRGPTNPYGTGGRIAVVLTKAGADFTNFDPLTQMSATMLYVSGGVSTEYMAPGTIYVETAADAENEGHLIIKGADKMRGRDLCCGAAVTGYGQGRVHFGRITLTKGAKAVVPPGVTLDLTGTEVVGADGEKKKFGFYVVGGTIVGGNSLAVPGELMMLDGTIDAESSSFTTGSQITLLNELGADVQDCSVKFTGDLEIGEGVSAAMDIPVAIDGDLTLGGTMTLAAASKTPRPLEVTVAGDMTITANGVVDVSSKGYEKAAVPSDQTAGNTHRSHGGRGYAINGGYAKSSVLPYGSIRNPVSAGCGSSDVAGGGAIRLVVEGSLLHNGVISANTLDRQYYVGSAGSVNIRAKTLSGAGRISADCGQTTHANELGCYGGGRVAVCLTGEGADFSSFTGLISAYGSRKNIAAAYVGGAGTVWLRTGAQSDDEGTLIVGNESDTLKAYQTYGYPETSVAGAFMDPTDIRFKDVKVGVAARLQLEEGKDMYVSGDFLNECEFVALAGSTVHFTGTGKSTLAGDFLFANIACDVPGKVLDIADGSVLKVTGEAAIASAEGEAPIVMQSAPDTTWTLDNSESSVVLENVALSNCQATAALTVKNGVDLGGNSANISFVTISGAELLTWTGEADTDWGNPDNWDLGRLPLAADQVVIPATAAQMPVMGVDITVSELAVSNGASLNFGSQTLTVNGPVTFAGSLVTAEGAVLKVTGDCAITGTVVPDTLSVRLLGEATQSFTANGQTFFAVETLAPTTAFAGDFTARTLVAGDGASPFAVTFAAAEKVTVGDFVAKGADAATCSLGCATTDGSWKLAASFAHVTSVTVSDSDASDGMPVYPSAGVVNGGNNANWMFDAVVTHWNGSVWTSEDPTADSVAWIDADTTLTADALSVKRLIVDCGATVRLTGALTVGDDVACLGTVEVNEPSEIGGDLVLLQGSTLTHKGSIGDPNPDVESYKIDLTVGGDVVIAADAAINVTGKGYAGDGKNSGSCSHGPGGTPKVEGKKRFVSASYGGRGYTGGYNALTGGYSAQGSDADYSMPCYGSIFCPTNWGSSGVGGSNAFGPWYTPGGGAVKLTCAGTLTVDGEIAADGGEYGGTDYVGSGGSIWLTVGTLEGVGRIHADGAHVGDDRYPSGGGGRVAVYLTDANDLKGFSGELVAWGGRIGNLVSLDRVLGSAGTVYVQTAADASCAGVLKIANRSTTVDHVAENATDLPGDAHAQPNELRNVRVEVATKGVVNLTADVTIRDINLLDTTARLKLNGHTLTVRSFRHAVSPDDTKQIDYGEGGKIDWLTPGLMILIR